MRANLVSALPGSIMEVLYHLQGRLVQVNAPLQSAVSTISQPPRHLKMYGPPSRNASIRSSSGTPQRRIQACSISKHVRQTGTPKRWTDSLRKRRRSTSLREGRYLSLRARTGGLFGGGRFFSVAFVVSLGLGRFFYVLDCRFGLFRFGGRLRLHGLSLFDLC